MQCEAMLFLLLLLLLLLLLPLMAKDCTMIVPQRSAHLLEVLVVRCWCALQHS
jgi:hypothetical protein